MQDEVLWEDDEIGQVKIRQSNKAKNISIRVRNDEEVILTVPSGCSLKKGLTFLNSRKEWIASHLKKTDWLIFDEDTVFSTVSFGVKIVKNTSHTSFLFRRTQNLLTVYCPDKLDIRIKEYQSIIRAGIERAMRSEAKRLLPKRLTMLAQEHNFEYNNVQIRSSKTRWGSCSAEGNINLSYFLLLLPGELIDYVLLHELCHTKEMNHGEAFWKLMDSVTKNRALELRSLLRSYKTSF
jgi:predicted metal-dependent hydrolase